MSVCFFNSLPNCEYSNHLIVAAISNSPLLDKSSSSAKNPYLLTFPDDKVKMLAVCFLNCIGLCFALFCY